MHVAQFVHRFPPAVGGAEAYFARLADFHASAGDDVTVWTTTALDLGEFWHRRPERERRNDTATVARAPGYEVRRFPPAYFPGRRYILKALSLVPVPRWQALTLPCNPICPQMWRDAGAFAGPLDAVHASAFPYSFPISCALRLARRRGVPFLLTPFLHLGDPADPRDRTRRQFTQPALAWLLRQADRAFVQTPSEFAAVEALGVPAAKIVLQGLGVDPADCTGGDRAAARAAWGVGDEVVIGHLANNSVEKGTVDLLAAVEAEPRFRVVLAGPEMPNFRRAWERFPRKDRVTRLGVLTEPQKRDFFAGIDAFALPSRTDSFGLVLLEAWANGKPVVAYRAGGPADLVRHDLDGVLTACNPDALKAGLIPLVDRADYREKLGTAGRDRVASEFRWAAKLSLVRASMAEAVRG